MKWSLDHKSSKDLKALGKLVSQSFIVELAFLLAFIINNFAKINNFLKSWISLSNYADDLEIIEQKSSTQSQITLSFHRIPIHLLGPLKLK